jgi:ribonuclease T2
MLKYFIYLFLFNFLFSVTFLAADASCDIDPKREKLYRLDLTVPATFCMRSNSDPSCKTFPKKSILQLHGLWPNYTSGFPEGNCDPSECKSQSEKLGKFCKYPEPKGLYNSSEWKSLSDYMAGKEKCLEKHEWVKHGVCSPLDPVAYFKWALERARDISKAFESLSDKPVGKEDVNALVEKNLPSLAGAIRLSCKGKNVSGVFVLYEWGNVPGNPIKTKGGRNGFGNCPKEFYFPSSPSE